jgi:hypothetical protein
MIALVVAAGLAGWGIASLAGSGSQSTPPPASHSGAPTTRTVSVDASALIGQPAHRVADELTSRGLQVQISWQPTDHARPGTVVAVSRDGQVPVGSTVTITAASRGNGGHGHDHGNGGDGHHGNGHGGD